tara:strand:+ start:54798 stop:55349 length:552 start_codon:yes stop_codon:yes gene_type:complete
MKNFRKCFVWLICFVFVAAIAGDLEARRSGGGGFKSSKPRTSRPKTTRPKTTPKKEVKRTNPNKKDSSKRTTKAPKRTAAQQKSYEKAKASGKAFGNKKAAAADFKAKNAGKYPSKYATKPSTRPDHIPQSTKGADGGYYYDSHPVGQTRVVHRSTGVTILIVLLCIVGGIVLIAIIFGACRS